MPLSNDAHEASGTHRAAMSAIVILPLPRKLLEARPFCPPYSSDATSLLLRSAFYLIRENRVRLTLQRFGGKIFQPSLSIELENDILSV
jgi:hypothetical protein